MPNIFAFDLLVHQMKI